MWMKRTRKKLTAVIAVFAILLVSLAPSISHALAAANGNSEIWVEICSATGSRMVKLDDTALPDPGKPEPAASHVANCLYCLTHVDSLAPLPETRIVVPVLSLETDLPPLYFNSPRPLFIWAKGQPRAPPVFS